MNSFTTPHLDSMAWTIDRDGVDAIPTSVLRELGFVAHQSGVDAGITNLLADTSAPHPVRQRAFGFIARHLARHRRHDTTSTASPDAVGPARAA